MSSSEEVLTKKILEKKVGAFKAVTKFDYLSQYDVKLKLSAEENLKEVVNEFRAELGKIQGMNDDAEKDRRLQQLSECFEKYKTLIESMSTLHASTTKDDIVEKLKAVEKNCDELNKTIKKSKTVFRKLGTYLLSAICIALVTILGAALGAAVGITMIPSGGSTVTVTAGVLTIAGATVGSAAWTLTTYASRIHNKVQRFVNNTELHGMEKIADDFASKIKSQKLSWKELLFGLKKEEEPSTHQPTRKE